MSLPTDTSDNDDDHHVFLESVRFQANGDDSHDQDGNASDEDDDSAQWTQLVFQRPCEAMVHVELFASGGYDHLLVLNLQQNAIQDLSPLLCVAPTLRVLNATQNAIAQLPSLAAFWKHFQHLTLCFLEGNRIRNWKDMDGLQACSATLLWLTLEGNPIMSLANARPFLINKLPFLKALDSFVVTDHELMKEPGPSARFAASSPSMDVSHLRMPLEFADNDAALLYLGTCGSEITRLHALNSPSIIIQRSVRGFLSQRLQFPRLTHVCALVTMVQKRIRGFLFRRMLQKEFHELVCTRGQQQFFLPFGGEPNESLLLFPCTARRGLKALIAYVQAWKRRFYIKKQAIAIKKIRFWCQMAYQRYKYKSRLLLQYEHQVCIYYTPCLEPVLLAAAEKAAHRDPFLMSMAPADRMQFLKQRCLPISGVSVLRVPQESTNPVEVSPPSVRRGRRTHRDGNGTPQSSHAVGVGCKGESDAVVRVFPSDISHENHLLISEKQLLHQDIERIANLKRQHQLAMNQTDTSSVEQDNEKRQQQPRAVLVHLSHLYFELEKRLVICNKKILHACIKLQDWKTRPRPRFSLSRVRIKPRGHPLMRWEKNKVKTLQAKQQQLKTNGRQYPKMHALIPWSIDMYLQILSLLNRHKYSTPPSSFALSYEQMRKVHAAVTIQCAWRAFMRQSKRPSVEVAIQRALVCIQRWWRFRVGLRRRMDFLRACVLLGPSITSRTLFMEEHVYRLLSDTASCGLVNAAMRPCREHHLHCRMVEGGHAQIALTPSQVKLRDASVHGRCCLHHHNQGSFHLREADAVSAQRCGAYFPVWLPGTPEHYEESMSSRDEDATPLLLVEHVSMEPTLLERELIVANGGGGATGDSEHHANHHLYQSFKMCDQVASTSSQVMALARRLFSHPTKKAWQLQSTVLALEATSFVRLTFKSIEEARRRALVLLAKTYDPVTRSYARLYSIEALFGAALRHHQWALSQVASAQECHEVLIGCATWLHADFPSPWWLHVQKKLGSSIPSGGASSPTMASRTETVQPLPQFQRGIPIQNSPSQVLVAPRTTVSPSSTMIPRPPPLSQPETCSSRPAPLHVIVPSVSRADKASSSLVATTIHSEPHPPPSSSPASSASGGWNRHQLLTDRMGKPKYDSVDAMRDAQLEEREYRVRDLREERERAMEALIVDRRMLQRESAAEVAGIKLDIDVKLQKINRLTRKFETVFAAQSGAMMRLAAREAVARNHEARKEAQKELTISVKTLAAEELERRQDAKSYWFVANQKAKRALSKKLITEAERMEENAHVRLVQIRTRIKEDKEIKQLLRLM